MLGTDADCENTCLRKTALDVWSDMDGLYKSRR